MIFLIWLPIWSWCLWNGHLWILCFVWFFFLNFLDISWHWLFIFFFIYFVWRPWQFHGLSSFYHFLRYFDQFSWENNSHLGADTQERQITNTILFTRIRKKQKTDFFKYSIRLPITYAIVTFCLHLTNHLQSSNLATQIYFLLHARHNTID